MVDDPPEPQGGEIPTTPRMNGSLGFSFHLRDTELLVTVFPGCRTRFFLPITTCHATASRIPSLSLSLSLYPLALPHTIAPPLQVGPLLFSLLLLSLMLSGRERSHLFQTTMLDGRLRLIRQRRTREADRCNQEDRFTKV